MTIIKGLLAYIEDLEESLDSADEALAVEGGCGAREWREGTPEFLSREVRLSYVREEHVDALDRSRAYLESVA